jgi:uncharacterized protein (DUF952 family)
MRGMRIFHIATLADWKAAEASGTYRTSTYGRTLEQEGFVHAAYHDQVPSVRDGQYGDVAEPLLVLEIETDLLGAEVRDEQVGDETYPHVYGPIPTSSVVAWRPARMPAIDVGTTRRTALPVPSSTLAFRGMALVLASAALTAFVCAVIAEAGTDDGDLPVGVSFLLWSLTAVLAVPALAALGYAEWVRRRQPRGD